jgi:hypothetical protein
MSTIEERRRAISEAFHSFHQPLTSLHCGLEITLLRQRSENEYRERVQDALLHAGIILRLNRALRELVEATDPGERFGNVSARSLLTKVLEEVLIVAEPALVAISAGDVPDVTVAADPIKLSRTLGQSFAYQITDLAPGSSVKLTSWTDRDHLYLKIVPEGKKRELAPDNSIEMKLRAINADAACAYIRTIGGNLEVTGEGTLEIKLPLML